MPLSMLHKALLVAAASLMINIVAGSVLDPEFDPSVYTPRVAHCNSVDIRYVDINPSGARTLLFVHGWPGLWSNWANQIAFFGKDPRYHLILPSVRGFAGSTHAGSTTMHALADDLLCVLKDAGANGTRTVCVGHDWGSQICAEALRSYPDVFEGGSGTIPYIPAAGQFVPNELIARMLPRTTYTVYFEKKTDTAVEELEKDVRRSLRAAYTGDAENPPPAAFLTSADDFLEAHKDVPLDKTIPLISDKEEDFLVKAYEQGGFRNTLYFYEHQFRIDSHEYASNIGRMVIDEPFAFIYPDSDPVADWDVAIEILRTHDFLPNMTMYKVHSAHWVMMENPNAYNEALKTWLQEKFPSPAMEQTTEAPTHDEL